MRGYRLIAAPGSMSSAKVRAILRWRNIAYRETLATRLTIRSEVTPRIGRAALPILITPSNETLQDPSDIFDYAERRHPGPSALPDGPAQRVAARLLETFADEYLVLAALHYRWTYDSEHATADIGRTVYSDLSPFEQRRYARRLAGRMAARLPALGLTPKTGPEIEAVLEHLLDTLDAHLVSSAYLFGDRPSIADFAFVGPLYAMLREPHAGALIRRQAPRVAEWARRVHAPDYPEAGDFIAGDVIPNAVAEALRLFTLCQLPILVETAAAVADWAESHPGKMNPPATVGSHTVRIGDTRMVCSLSTEAFWSFQRALDTRDAVEPEARGAVNRLFDRIGAPMLKDFTVRRRLKREHFRLRLELPRPGESAAAPVFSAANPQPLADLLNRKRDSAERFEEVEQAMAS